MEYKTLKGILLVGLICLANTLASAQNCKVNKVDYDPVDISEFTALQGQKNSVDSSRNYVDILYVVLGTSPIGYRLIVNEDGSYKLIKSFKDKVDQNVKSGVLKINDLEKLKGLKFEGTTFYLGKCASITSFESSEFLLVKKVGLLKIYSLDGELENTFKENKNTIGLASSCLELLNCIIEKNPN
jgi:hypothetical protein